MNDLVDDLFRRTSGHIVSTLTRILGHHSFICAFVWRQIIEKWGGYGGSIEPISVVRDPFRKEQQLQTLRVVERRLHPAV